MRRILVICLLLSGTLAQATLAAHSPTWVVVRLRAPLGEAGTDEAFSLATGRPALDAAIAREKVSRIDSVLSISPKKARFPVALSRHGLDRTYRFHVPPGTDIEALAAKLSLLDEVEFAEPDMIGTGGLTPNDPRFNQQTGFHGILDFDVDAPEAWEIETGSGVIIAVLDTGLDSDHEDLSAKAVPGNDFANPDSDPEDDQGHGTNVSSIAAASTNNAVGVAGACWGCRIMPVKVLDAANNGLYSWWTNGMIWAADNGAQVINLSAGGTSASQLLLSGVAYAYDAGVIHVSITHNDSTGQLRYPGRYAAPITVGASDGADRRAAFSNWGPEIDVVAPGVFILGAAFGGGYNSWTGSSQAAPLVTGLVGLMLSLDPALGREEARFLIQAGAEDEVGDPGEDAPGFDDYHGWGRVNMHRTLQAVESSISLRVDGGATTRVFLETANPLASSYDFVRGNVKDLGETSGSVRLGKIVCIENDSADPDTAGDEDTETPPPGEAFFYLARFAAAPGSAPYGGSSRHRDRFASAEIWSGAGGQPDAAFGATVSAAGDVNNDGFGDVIVGAPGYDGDLVDEGAAFVFLGSADGLSATPAWVVEGDQVDSLFGHTVAGAGDVNDDGYDDVIVGAPLHDNGEQDEGRAYLYLGGPGGPGTVPSWTAEPDQAFAQFGFSVDTAGDVNGDGHDDVIVGAWLYDNLLLDRGRAFVYHGAGIAAGLETTAAWFGETSFQGGSWFGFSVGAAGDVNDDGFDDVIVGAPSYDGGQANEGAAFIYHGSMSGLAVAAARTLELDIAGADLGQVVGSAGNVNGDAWDDVFVGAPDYPGAGDGAVFVFRGSATGVEAASSWSFIDDVGNTGVGESAASAGDVNLDGFSDLVLGAELHDDLRSDEGRARVFFGSSSGLSANADWTMAGGETSSGFAGSVASAGDVDGDGLDDLIVGAATFDDGVASQGLSFVYRGPLIDDGGDCPR